MYILLTDETNSQPASDVKFFVYGGIFFPMEELAVLDQGIESIRTRYGYKRDDEFKFDTRSRPAYVSSDAHVEAKKEVISLCLSEGCRLIVQVILHEIIRNQDIDQQVRWAADYVFGKFNEYLSGKGDFGICAVDNLPAKAPFKYLGEKFTKGLTLSSGSTVRLDRIKLFSATCVNASHSCSAMDIILGSFRYCINNPKNQEAAKEMLGKVADLLWGGKEGRRLLRNW